VDWDSLGGLGLPTAGAVLTALPVIAAYMYFQRYGSRG
jgi:ABC-type maltose transport system permease subunit